MSRRSLAALLALLVTCACLAGVGAARLDAGDGSPATSLRTNGSASTMEIEIRADGDARWHVSTAVSLDTQEDVAAFERLASDFEDGTVGLGLEAFERASAEAARATGRDMAIENVSRRSERRDESGVLVLSFTWTEFAVVDGDRVRVGDAFNTTDGTWLPRLSDGQTLVITPPDGYGIHSAPIGPDAETLRWTGPRTFDSGDLWVVYQIPTTETPTPNSPTPNSPTPQQPWPVGVPLWGVLGGLGGVVVVVYFLGRRRGGVPGAGPDDSPGPAGGAETAETESNPTGGSAAGASTADATGSDAGSPAGGTGAAEETEPATPGATEGVSDPIDAELLSDEERVERLLEANGGRMKQASIVKETGWSNAKVSQLLSSMAEEGRIEKLRLGRENLISFPEEDVTDFDS